MLQKQKNSGSGWLTIQTLVTGILIFPLSLIILGILFNLPLIHGLYETLESFIYFHIFISTANPSEHIIIIDEEQEKNVFNREQYAQLLEKLGQMGAKVIALDVVFDTQKDSLTDARLAQVTQQNRDKLIHAVEFISHDNHAIIPPRFHLQVREKPSRDNYIEGISGAILPYPELLTVTDYLGHVTARSDEAGRDEQYFPLIVYYNNQIYASLPLMAVMKFLDCPDSLLFKKAGDHLLLAGKTDTLKIPVNSKTQVLINFMNRSNFAGKIFSFDQAIAFSADDSLLIKNKIVLIGNSLDSGDQADAPHFQSYPNLIIYAGLISQILNQENIREGIFESIFLAFGLVLLALLFLIYFRNRIKRFRRWYLYIFSLVLIILIAIITLNFRIRLYIMLPYISFILTFLATKKFYRHRLRKITQAAKQQAAQIERVFISYSHEDTAFVKRLKSALEAQGVAISIDIDTLKFGDQIEEFITRSVESTDFTISIVSKNSLQSAWVIEESLETLLYEKFTHHKKYVPIFIDKEFLEDTFQNQVIEGIENSINKIVAEINRLSKKYIPSTNLDQKKTKLMELRNNIHKILTQLNESLVGDFSSDEKFEENLPKLIALIKQEE